MLDGGAAPPAPPGKGSEPPPEPEEFSKTLQKAQGEDETPGEVAVNEPNARLQKLDSKEKTTGKEIPVSVLVEQIAIIPVQIAAPQQAIALSVTASKDSNPDAVKAPVKSDCQEHTPLLDSKKGKSDTDSLLANLISGNQAIAAVVAQTDQVAPTPQSSKTDTSSQSATQTISKEISGQLNITSVKSTTGAAITQQASTAIKSDVKADAAKPVAKSDAKFSLEATSQDSTAQVSKDSSFGRDADGDTQSDSKQDQSSNQTQLTFAGTTEMKKTSDVDSTNSTGNQQLTTADRQRVVDTLTKRIEELSVRSVRSEVRVEMQPAELGSVVVNVRKGLEGMTATLTASNETLRQALHESRNDLAGTLADRNVGQVRIEVRSANADTMNMGQQFSHANSQQSQNHQQQQHRQATANLMAARQSTAPETSSTQTAPSPRRTSTTSFDMEI